MSGRSGYGYTGGTNDFGESFIEVQRQQRFRKPGGGPPSRARSEVGEILAYGNGPMAHNAYRHRRESSYQEQMQNSFTERPRSSFEPAASSRVIRSRADDWYEVERKVNDYSSEEEDDLELESDRDDDSRDEMARYHFKQAREAPPPQQQQNQSVQHSYLNVPPPATHRRTHHQEPTRASSRGGYGFDPNEVYYFGVIHLSPEKVQKILSSHPPPYEYRDLTPIERAAYLFYFTLYRKYFQPLKVFHRVFNREFYKYTCEGNSEDMALWKDEYKQRVVKRNQAAYDLSQKHLFSDERGTPDSRLSDPSRVEQDSDIVSIDSVSKEPLKFRVPHAFLNFSIGGRVIYVNPESSVSTIRMDDAKVFIKDRTIRRNIEALESFKGPLRFGETQTQTPLLFIQRQIDRILQSDVYRGNPASSDANDCLLIWRLLEMLVRQHGRVTGPDLAHLLTRDYSYTSIPPVRGRSDATLVQESGHSSNPAIFQDERYVSPSSVDKYTQFLLLGLVDEAIDAAMNDGLYFDALILAHRMYKSDQRKLEEYEAKLLARRPQQHPTMTLIHVAAQTKVPILTNTSSDDASGWRAHIAIVLANLNTESAIDTVYQLGLELARKEFNSAADFCFLAVNLLNPNFDAFRPPPVAGDESNARRHIKLINASLPDDEFHSTATRFAWSITDFQATEIYDYALKLASGGMPTKLSSSAEFQTCRVQYAQMLAEYGGFNKNAFDYCDEVARAIWGVQTLVYELPPLVLTELCDMAERLKFMALPNGEDPWFVGHLRTVIDQVVQTQPQQQNVTQAQPKGEEPVIPVVLAPVVTESGEHLAANFTPGATSTPNVTAIDHHQTPRHINNSQVATDLLSETADHHPHNIQPAVINTFASNGYQQLYQDPPLSPIHSTESESSTRASSMSPRGSSAGEGVFDYDGRRESLPAYYHGQNVQVNDQPQQTYVQYQQTQQTRSRINSNRQRTTSESSNATLDGASVIQANKQQYVQTPPQEHEQPYVHSPKIHPSHDSSPPPKTVSTGDRSRLDSRGSDHLYQTDHFSSDSSPAQRTQSLITHSQSQPIMPQKAPPEQKPPQQQGVPQAQPGQPGNKKAAGGSGLLGGIGKKLASWIPDSSAMKLPDDSNPTIRYDPVLGRYVGDGVEEEYAPPPPPAAMLAAASAQQQPIVPAPQAQVQPVANGQVNLAAPVSSLQAMRRVGSARYKNVLEDTIGGGPAKNPMLETPLGMGQAPPLPSTFGFIPTPIDSGDGDTFNPFSDAPAGGQAPAQEHHQ